MRDRVYKTNEEWLLLLTPEQYRVLREREDEPSPGRSLPALRARGLYRCVACGLALFSSEARFDSGKPWPGFRSPWRGHHLATHEDRSHFLPRTEVVCSRCGSHLGYLLGDGPPPTGLHYSIHPVALAFEPHPSPPSHGP